MIQLAGCEDGGCPGLWVEGDQLLAQGTVVTDPQMTSRTNPAPGEALVALPKRMLGEAFASALGRILV